jgi:hypothetical protein
MEGLMTIVIGKGRSMTSYEVRDPVTGDVYPCATLEEAQKIAATLTSAVADEIGPRATENNFEIYRIEEQN